MSIDTNTITLKTVHLDSFRRETTKTRIFILQVDNKITDVVKTFKERKIRYIMSLLRKMTTKQTTTYIDQYRETTFSTYQEFKRTFLERFTNPNLIKMTIKKLLNIRQEKLLIQKYVTKTLSLTNKTRRKTTNLRVRLESSNSFKLAKSEKLDYEYTNL